MTAMTLLTADSFAGIVSERMAAEAIGLSAQWFTRLKELLPVTANEVFPSEQILDHIPLLIADVGRYLQAPEDEEIAANAAVIEKARELGVLRHAQQASVHQLLREYEILGEILESFVGIEAARLPVQPTAIECFEVVRRVTRATRTLMRTTVETFIAEYTSTIQERNERLKTFNRMASHELRTPLGTLLFAAAALEQPVLQGDVQRMARVAEAIRSNTQQLARLVENLQRIARLSESPDAPNVQEIDVTALASEVARQLQDMAAARGVEIRVHEPLPTLVVDPARLELVLMNLVSNAIKYSDPQKPSQRVEVFGRDGDAPGSVSLIVRDNGLGVPDGLRDTIFDRFTRAHAHLDETLGVSGTGLGLAIVAECVEAVGGRIVCESAVGEGTTFIVTLPLEPGPANAVPVAF
jgi:signal transduction histidine kinase